MTLVFRKKDNPRKCIESRGSDASRALLRHDEAAWCRKKDAGKKSLRLHLEGCITNNFEVGAGVVHQDKAGGANLGQEAFDLSLADRHVTVGEEEIDGAIDVHLERRLVAKLDPVGEAGGGDFIFGFREDEWIELTADDSAETVGLKPLGDPEGADTEKRAGLDDQLRLDGGDEGTKEFEDFGLGGHGVVHVPALGVGALRCGAMVLRQQRSCGAFGLEHDFVFLFQLLAEETHGGILSWSGGEGVFSACCL